MKEHFERKIVFSDKSEFQNLYEWSVREESDEGTQIGRDYIPWEWTLQFSAKRLTLHENLSIGSRYATDEDRANPKAVTRRFISAALSPADFYDRVPSYSMLGTGRVIDEFNLHIEVAGEAGERCLTRGNVSYTSEVDFVNITYPDELWVFLYVSEEVFNQYANRIALGQVDRLSLHIGNVDGFYAEWSPGITADRIKVLTSDRSHKVVDRQDASAVPRLGKVGEVELRFEQRAPVVVETENDLLDENEVDDDSPENYNDPLTGPRAQKHDNQLDVALKMLTSLRTLGWVIAVLLLVGIVV